MGLLVVLAAIGASAATAVPASAAQGIKMQTLMNPDGSGRLFVNSSGGPWSWEACASDRTGCVPFGRGREIETKGARSGTVFRVKSQGLTTFSPEWRGHLRTVSPPTVHGVVRANEFVSPLPGTWRGGWASEDSEMQLSACATPQGHDCTTLTDWHYLRPCPTSPDPPFSPRRV